MERLLTAKELAGYLNVPLSYVRHRCHHKTIPFIKLGNHVRFRLSDVEPWLNQSTIYPTTMTLAESDALYGKR